MGPRLLTIFIMVPLIIYGTYVGGVSFLLLVTGLAFFSLNEYYSLFAKIGRRPLIIEGQALSVFFIFLASSQIIILFWTSLLTSIFTFFCIFFFIFEIFLGRLFLEKSNILATIRGSIYTGWFLSYLILIRNFTTSRLTFFLIATVWANDTAAYLIGTFIGRGQHQLAPFISPKKTWEGALGGFLGAVATAYLFGGIFQIPFIHTLILALIISATAQIGDLVESFLKRKAGVKNSSEILPGHGGILDRLDSFILSAPIFYYYCLWFGV